MTPPRQVADGVYRLGTDWVGWYLIVDDDSVTVVDCGFPGYHDQLPAALAELDRPLDSVEAWPSPTTTRTTSDRPSGSEPRQGNGLRSGR